MCFQPIGTGAGAFRRLLSHIPLPRGEGAHRGAATGVEEEVGSVGCSRGLVGDGPVAQGHAHDRSHVGLCAKHVDGDPCGLPCGSTQKQSVSSGESSTKAQQKAGGRNKMQE